MKCLSLFWKSAEKPRPPSSFSSGRHDNTTSCTSNSCEVSGMGSFRTIADMFEQKIGSLRTFDLAELYVATNGFSRRMRIGEGGFGSVYRGVVKSPRGERVQVAVKKLNREGLQGNKEWRAEIQFLSVVDHPNLVKLLGYCGEENNEGIQRLLIYEFMPNRSLEDHLFTKGQIYLSWETRLKIALGAAEGLRYLHEGLQIQVIYRDFKASNILLDDNFNAKLSDFGLAREGPSDGRSHVTTHVMGTCGYASPDYIRTGHLTIKSDVWSFGVVLFEILTGRRCLEPNLPRPERKLLDWMKGFPADF